jgi:hypothetical protein
VREGGITVEHIHKKIERLEHKLADALIRNIQYKQENASLKHTNQGLVNMIEGLQNTNRRLLAVNAEYKSQAIRWANPPYDGINPWDGCSGTSVLHDMNCRCDLCVSGKE